MGWVASSMLLAGVRLRRFWPVVAISPSLDCENGMMVREGMESGIWEVGRLMETILGAQISRMDLFETSSMGRRGKARRVSALRRGVKLGEIQPDRSPTNELVARQG